MASSILCSALGKPVTSSWFRKIGRIKTQKKVCLLVYVFFLTNQNHEDCPPCGQLQMAGASRASAGTSWDPCLRQTHDLCLRWAPLSWKHSSPGHTCRLCTLRTISNLPFAFSLLSLPNTIPTVYADFFLSTSNVLAFGFSTQFFSSSLRHSSCCRFFFFLHSWYWACFLCLFSTVQHRSNWAMTSYRASLSRIPGYPFTMALSGQNVTTYALDNNLLNDVLIKCQSQLFT